MFRINLLEHADSDWMLFPINRQPLNRSMLLLRFALDFACATIDIPANPITRTSGDAG
jgi:hypothetical protein